MGRPTKMNDKTVKLLEEAWMLGCTDKEACLSAGITTQTLTTYQNANLKFLDRKELLKHTQILKARKVLANSLDSKVPWEAVSTAKTIIEKKDGKAAEQLDVNVKGVIVHRKVYELIPPVNQPLEVKSIEVKDPMQIPRLVGVSKTIPGGRPDHPFELDQLEGTVREELTE
jgi:hypothetical protein